MPQVTIPLDQSAAKPIDHTPSSPEGTLKLTDVFRPTCIETIPHGTGKSSVISLLVRCLTRAEYIDGEYSEQLIADLLERERCGSSAMGRGLAFPHLRTRIVTHFVGAIGLAPGGINFGALDGNPTRLVLLTLSPWDGREAHTNLLSRLVSLMQDKSVTHHLNHNIKPPQLYTCLCDLDKV